MATVRELQKDFLQLAEENNLFHAYLFFGSKNDFPITLAKFLEYKDWQSEKPLIDAMICGAGIDGVREGIKFLWQKPLRSPRKTLIIPAAEKLTLEAQNAILKIAEEPPAHALIILTVRNSDALLPTLVSRFQKIYIHNTNDTNGITNDTNNGTNDANTLVKKFIKENERGRKEIIKELVDPVRSREGSQRVSASNGVENFVTEMIAELRKDEIKNWKTLKELLKRWTFINQFNTNKKLQLEAALLQVKSP